jgi:hypothetical protein
LHQLATEDLRLVASFSGGSFAFVDLKKVETHNEQFKYFNFVVIFITICDYGSPSVVEYR